MMLSDNDKREKARLLMECIVSIFFDDDERHTLNEMADKIIPDPQWPDYLFWPRKHDLDGSIDAAIEKAFAYKPIILGPPPDKK